LGTFHLFYPFSRFWSRFLFVCMTHGFVKVTHSHILLKIKHIKNLWRVDEAGHLCLHKCLDKCLHKFLLKRLHKCLYKKIKNFKFLMNDDFYF
jgi:hypothetical protein